MAATAYADLNDPQATPMVPPAQPTAHDAYMRDPYTHAAMQAAGASQAERAKTYQPPPSDLYFPPAPGVSATPRAIQPMPPAMRASTGPIADLINAGGNSPTAPYHPGQGGSAALAHANDPAPIPGATGPMNDRGGAWGQPHDLRTMPVGPSYDPTYQQRGPGDPTYQQPAGSPMAGPGGDVAQLARQGRVLDAQNHWRPGTGVRMLMEQQQQQRGDARHVADQTRADAQHKDAIAAEQEHQDRLAALAQWTAQLHASGTDEATQARMIENAQRVVEKAYSDSLRAAGVSDTNQAKRDVAGERAGAGKPVPEGALKYYDERAATLATAAQDAQAAAIAAPTDVAKKNAAIAATNAAAEAATQASTLRGQHFAQFSGTTQAPTTPTAPGQSAPPMGATLPDAVAGVPESKFAASPMPAPVATPAATATPTPFALPMTALPARAPMQSFEDFYAGQRATRQQPATASPMQPGTPEADAYAARRFGEMVAASPGAQRVIGENLADKARVAGMQNIANATPTERATWDAQAAASNARHTASMARGPVPPGPLRSADATPEDAQRMVQAMRGSRYLSANEQRDLTGAVARLEANPSDAAAIATIQQAYTAHNGRLPALSTPPPTGSFLHRRAIAPMWGTDSGDLAMAMPNSSAAPHGMLGSTVAATAIQDRGALVPKEAIQRPMFGGGTTALSGDAQQQRIAEIVNQKTGEYNPDGVRKYIVPSVDDYMRYLVRTSKGNPPNAATMAKALTRLKQDAALGHWSPKHTQTLEAIRRMMNDATGGAMAPSANATTGEMIMPAVGELWSDN